VTSHTFTKYIELMNPSQALKIFIRSQSPSIAEKAQVLISLEVLPTQKPPVTDLDAIDLYDEALESVLPEQQASWGKVVGELRCHSVKASPKDETLSRKCLKACLSKGDLDHARQVFFQLSASLTPAKASYRTLNAKSSC
jgi:N-terminal acetyltransferase B complex non-catalytic subunit